jgi:hypothetical protein
MTIGSLNAILEQLEQDEELVIENHWTSSCFRSFENTAFGNIWQRSIQHLVT